MSKPSIALLVLFVTTAVCSASAAPQDKAKSDPRRAEVPLPARGGWHARLVYRGDSGIWCVGTIKCLPRQVTPEIFALDDRGRCTILSSYSGTWSPIPTTEDGGWLGALVMADLDPTEPGEEMYAAGRRGNVYQFLQHERAAFDVRLMAQIPGEEIHTLVAGDLVVERAGPELLAFTAQGDVVELRFDPERRRFETIARAKLPGRVRQAVLLPRVGEEPATIAAVGGFGALVLLRMGTGGLKVHEIAREPAGLGRLALRRPESEKPLVLYVGRDDGMILRFERGEGAAWRREAIYAGPQGTRGVAAGRFDADPDVETVAVFGYSTRVQLLSRKVGEAWRVETIFTDVDRGHWLEAAELDGRNVTDELIGSGFGKRVFLLSRPPGYGLDEVPTDPDAEDEPREDPEGEDEDARRVRLDDHARPDLDEVVGACVQRPSRRTTSGNEGSTNVMGA